MITVNAHDLADALRAAHRFTADDEDWQPDLRSIHLEAGGDVLCATATNRYVAGHIRTTAAGTLPALLIDRSWVRVAADALANLDDSAIVQVRAVAQLNNDDGTVELTSPARLTLRMPARSAARYPNMRELFAKRDAKPAGLDEGVIGLNPALARPFTKAAQDLGADGDDFWRWYFAGPKTAVRVQVGSRLTGLIMPLSLDRAAPAQPIPVGLPA